MNKKFFSDHFFLIIFLTYKNSKIKFFFKKKFISYSFSRSFLKKNIKIFFTFIKKKLFGNNICLYIRKKTNKNKYILFKNFSKKLLFEIYFLFIKVIFYYK